MGGAGGAVHQACGKSAGLRTRMERNEEEEPKSICHLCFKKEHGSTSPSSAALEASRVTLDQSPFMPAVPA